MKKSKRGAKAKTSTVLPTDPLNSITGIELFFGLVGPTGTDTTLVCKELAAQLRKIGYESEIISLSDLIREYSGLTAESNEYHRILALMKEGNRLCESSAKADFIARLGLIDIRRRRKTKSGDEKSPAPRTAYILRSFKRKEEVELFRSIYGKAFTLISIYSSREERLDALAHRLAASEKLSLRAVEHEAVQLINTDEEDGNDLGQKVRDTFPLADYFVTVSDRSRLKSQLSRLVQLIFGDPYLTPTREEHAMFFAQAEALRSGDLSRQVGAVIVSSEGEILATGCNDAPKAHGGLYWSDDPQPKRDLELGHDMNAKIKREIVEELFYKLKKAKWMSQKVSKESDATLYESAVIDKKGALKDSQLLDVIEFGRAVHAEMAAITDAAKRGVSLKGARLFCTTFPCHLCARHIISSGIEMVIYVEPYPKSRTEDLFSDSVAINPSEKNPDKVNFFPFVGVAPGRYFDFFQMTGKRKDKYGNTLDIESGERSPKIKRFVLSYILIEENVVEGLPDAA
ncbi:anti-phage dCTP deaminase [Herbaspirillum huttiense]|uniref:anti-phage dCTP deaminase n=1 Tax=Herbaspirillum huttiense TaxID=863372 RepID=UPI002E792D40|nr:anti-phage dCTP deaminase [Herbaspirillum huttiense]MEE1636920.1 anti-phage dCTP deaminase [Herbaspirillum huttiense NC40101]